MSEEPNLVPLAEKLRPKKIEEIIGQNHLFGQEGFFANIILNQWLDSMIFWGPPGSGKTSAAQILIKSFGPNFSFIKISAIFSGIADLKKIFEKAKEELKEGRKTILFVDEIHRFNKTQQDCLLPAVEDGTIILIGATTENPSFELNNALLSRVCVVRFYPLSDEDIKKLLSRAESLENKKLPLNSQLRKSLIGLADGDARIALGFAEKIWKYAKSEEILNQNEFEKIIQKPVSRYDKDQDIHYNLISALHKSIRGSDPNAALYYLTRMLEGGEDRLYLCRRLMRIACEDVGLADPQALSITCAAQTIYRALGTPEGEVAIIEACLYLATAPKSNAIYMAAKAAQKDAVNYGSLPPPLHILNGSTKFLREEGYGRGYIYDHDCPHAFSGQNYFPENFEPREYYHPVNRGFEKEIKKRMSWWTKTRFEKGKDSNSD